MLGDLQWWQRQSAYDTTLALGRDVASIRTDLQTAVRSQEHALTTHMASLVEHNASANARLLASTERVHDGLDLLHVDLQDLSYGLASLGATFEWGFSAVLWQLEQMRSGLREILAVLKQPQGTQAAERKAWADAAYAKGLVDDALTDYLESIRLYRYDFSAHLSIATIYRYEKKDYPAAIEAYANTIHYALPDAPEIAAMAALQMSEVLRGLGQYAEAASKTEECLSWVETRVRIPAPDLARLSARGHYEHAINLALLDRPDDLAAHLRQAVAADTAYWLRYLREDAFRPHDQTLSAMFGQIVTSKEAEARAFLQDIDAKMPALEAICQVLADAVPCPVDVEACNRARQRAESLASRHSYLDAIEALHLARDTAAKIASAANAMLSRIRSQADHQRKQRSDAVRHCEEIDSRLRMGQDRIDRAWQKDKPQRENALSDWLVPVASIGSLVITAVLCAYVFHIGVDARTFALLAVVGLSLMGLGNLLFRGKTKDYSKTPEGIAAAQEKRRYLEEVIPAIEAKQADIDGLIQRLRQRHLLADN